MQNLGASNNLMPKVVMEKLGLQITKSYHDLCYLNSRRVKCIGLTKESMVSSLEILTKCTIIDKVVADIPTKSGMLFSRSWLMKL